jgi:hypothetical protein
MKEKPKRRKENEKETQTSCRSLNGNDARGDKRSSDAGHGKNYK